MAPVKADSDDKKKHAALTAYDRENQVLITRPQVRTHPLLAHESKHVDRCHVFASVAAL